MRIPRNLIPRATLAFLFLLALAALVVAGCSKQAGTLTGPSSATSASAGLLARNPADLAATMRIQDNHTDALMKIPGVIGTGTGALADGRAAVLVLTRVPDVKGIPTTLDGVPVDVRVIGDVHAYVSCGTSTGRDDECAAGTLGCVVLKGGNKFYLSNNHVFAAENAGHAGDRIDAPGRYDGKPKCAQTPQLGTLSDFQAISFGGTNTIDCAIAAPSAGNSVTCAEAAGYTPSSTVVSPSVGLAVKKDGRTSKLTTGTIQAINVTINVGYSSGTATFTGQIMTPGNFLRSGDSGSLMVTQSGNNPVGLCFAGGGGGSFANPIGPVLSRFSATVCNQ
jgi:hypothetical protein